MLQISPTLLAALSGPTVCTVRSIIEEYGLSIENIFSTLMAVQEQLDRLELNLDPPLGALGIDDTRVLKKRSSEENLHLKIRSLIEKGEGQNIEFKSSIFIDTKKHEHNPDLTLAQCISEPLKEKVSREIAALLNAQGGSIIFGVTDDGGLRGCDDDFATYKAGGSASDKADLIIREIVNRYFLDSDSVFYHIQVECCNIEEKNVVLLSIAQRKQISFLKAKEPSQLFIRVGTHAIPVPFEKIEQYFEMTQK
jgi:predicted HTH transcriptional regulator